MALLPVLLLLWAVSLPASGVDSDGAADVHDASIDEMRAILARRGATCRKCSTREDYANRVAQTKSWTTEVATSPDRSIRVTKTMFFSKVMKQMRQAKLKSSEEAGARSGHELDHDADEDDDRGPLARHGADEDGEDYAEDELERESSWEDFRRAVEAGEIAKDADGNFRKTRPLGWHVYAQWLLTCALACCWILWRCKGLLALPEEEDRPPSIGESPKPPKKSPKEGNAKQGKTGKAKKDAKGSKGR